MGSVFTIPSTLSSLGGKTLLEALRFQGGSDLSGAAEILLRAAVAALLNSASSVSYPLTTQQIIAEVNAALASGSRATILAEANRLDRYNNLGCPLN